MSSRLLARDDIPRRRRRATSRSSSTSSGRTTFPVPLHRWGDVQEVRALRREDAGLPKGRGPWAEAITVRYEDYSKEAHPNAETWTFYLVRADGISETTSQTLRFDGKEYPCGDLGLAERPDTVVSTKLDVRTARVSYIRSGRVTRLMVRTVSADGKQMTLEVRITPEKGPETESLMVFTR